MDTNSGIDIKMRPNWKIKDLKKIIFYIGAVEKTRTSTLVKEQRPQRCASTNSATTALNRVYLKLFEL